MNTFQCVIATRRSDNRRGNAETFVIFHYADEQIQWSIPRTESDLLHAQVGFNNQNGNYALPGATTAEVINITQTTNVGIPGKWIFQVDQGIEQPTSKILI